MGIWGDIGKAMASSLLSDIESKTRNYSSITSNPEKAENARKAAESAKRLRETYFGDD